MKTNTRINKKFILAAVLGAFALSLGATTEVNAAWPRHGQRQAPAHVEQRVHREQVHTSRSESNSSYERREHVRRSGTSISGSRHRVNSSNRPMVRRDGQLGPRPRVPSDIRRGDRRIVKHRSVRHHIRSVFIGNPFYYGQDYYDYFGTPVVTVYNVEVPQQAMLEPGMIRIDNTMFDRGSLAKVKSNGKWGILGTDGQVSIAPVYKNIQAAVDGTFYGEMSRKDISNGKWGIMDKAGQWYVEPTYEDIVIL